jgi:signal peptidase II
MVSPVREVSRPAPEPAPVHPVEGPDRKVTSVKRVRVFAALLCVAVLAADQLSKEWALQRLASGPVDLVPTLRLALFHNDGASFSTGAGQGRLIGALVIVIIGAVVWMLVHQRRTPQTLVLAAVLGGALGNLGDRVFRADEGFLTGRVVDFIDVTWFAVFNVADSFVVVGALTFGLLELLDQRNSRDASEAPTEPA